MTKLQEDLLKLEQFRDEALMLMRRASFPLDEPIGVELDPDLPYMGYTTEKEGRPLIVVSGFALKDNMALNLLIHEMSHVYRTQTEHPSHDQNLLTAITSWVTHGKVVESYQDSIVHAIVNNLQDVYADDISFKIFEKSEHLNEFFMNWIQEPVIAKNTEDRWYNAEKLVSAAFADANLKRHGIPDTGGKVAKAIDQFLAKCDANIVEKYPFFKEFLVRMPENVTEKEFEKMLILYLREFVKLTK